MKNIITKKQNLNISEKRVFFKINNLTLKKHNFKFKPKTKFLKKKKSNNKYKYIFIPLFIISIYVIYSRLIYSKNKRTFKHKPTKSDIYFEEKFPNRGDSLNNAKEFLKICLDNKLINNKIIKSSNNPKVSAVIPLYNCQRTISRAIKSVQNQNISDIEIILVNDYSKDETLSIVEQIQKEDPRIKIINNKKNMGTLYTRSIGALSAKGEYIFPLDGDDMLLDKDVYSTITKIADKGNFDIVGFRGLIAYVSNNSVANYALESFFSDQKDNHVLFQPELGLYPLRPGNNYKDFKVMDVYLWKKCIKTNIYQKALNKAGEERYSRFMVLHEDVLAIYILFNTAESMKYIGKYGILYIPNSEGTSKKFNIITHNINHIYLADTVIEFTKDTFESKRVLVYIITSLLERSTLKETLERNEYVKKLFISCLNKILNMKYISDKDKKEIKDRTSKFEFLKF